MKLYVINIPPDESFASCIPEGYTKRGTTSPSGTALDGSVLCQYWRTNPETDASYFITEEDFMHNKKHIRRLLLVHHP